MAKRKLAILEQEFNQDQIVAILGMFLAGLHKMDPKKFNAHFELKTDFDEENRLKFAAHLKMVEVEPVEVER